MGASTRPTPIRSSLPPPYYTDDKIAENSVNTGPVACLFVQRGAQRARWEPFRGQQADPWQIERKLYKNIAGNKLIFEECNHDLGLTYRYAWRTSDRFGFVRTVWLQNNLAQPCRLHLLDGVQNLLPYGATTALQTTMSNLLDAYKRNELEPTTGLGIFALSATLTDRAEPSESLMATVAWQVGLPTPTYLLSTTQLATFRRGQPIVQETDIKGQRAAYLLCADLELGDSEEQSWSLVADVNQDHSRLAALCNLLRGDAKAVARQVEMDIALGSAEWNRLVASADGLQITAEPLTTAHHFANVAFHIRAGIGFNKSPDVYGAFPTDPYSHTPKGQGAKQPGMTGQVKEEILTRLGELGVCVEAGALHFDPALLQPQEFMAAPALFEYVGVDGQPRALPLPASALAFTLCQTPVILMCAGDNKIEVVYTSGQRAEIEGNRLEPAMI